MPKYLVVYYSRTGHTGRVAKALAEMLGADLEPVREAGNRLGFMDYWRSLGEALVGTLPAIAPARHDPADYDVVILGSPVWASRPSSPMRSYLATNRRKLKTIACFVTLGGSGAAKALARIEEAAGTPSRAAFSVTAGELKTAAWRKDLKRFADEIERSVTA